MGNILGREVRSGPSQVYFRQLHWCADTHTHSSPSSASAPPDPTRNIDLPSSASRCHQNHAKTKPILTYHTLYADQHGPSLD